MRLTIFGATGGTGQDLVPSLSDVKDTRGRGQVAGKTLLGPAHKPLLRRAELPSVRFHDLRHTCATLLFTRGVHPKIVSEVLGHSSISITLDVYSHVIPGLGDAAAVAMEDALGDGPGVGYEQPE